MTRLSFRTSQCFVLYLSIVQFSRTCAPRTRSFFVPCFRRLLYNTTSLSVCQHIFSKLFLFFCNNFFPDTKTKKNIESGSEKMTVILIRTVIIYFSLIIAMRLMGKRQIGELEVSDLVTTLIVSKSRRCRYPTILFRLCTRLSLLLFYFSLRFFSSILLAKCPRLKGLVSSNPQF